MSHTTMQLSVASWASGIAYEVQFWTDWARTKGGAWPEDFVARQNKKRELDPSIGRLLPEKAEAEILDVGAGPLTILGCIRGNTRVNITAVDPLASLYRDILARANVVPPTATKFANAEDLSAFFEPSCFDLVHCRNALDHSFDPVRGIEEMLRVVKVGGHVVLRHFINEAEAGKYSGFHQYNFCSKEDRFCIWNRKGETFPDVKFERIGKFAVETDESSNSVQLIIHKFREFDDAECASQFRARIRDLTQGMIEYYLPQESKK